MKHERVRLVYFSRNLIVGEQSAVLQEVEQILATSRRNNLQCHITGALLFNSGCFAQVLEGRREDVEMMFKRIQQDKRHANIQLLSVEHMTARLFPGWSMGFIGRSRLDQQLFGHVAESTGLDHRNFEGHQILKLMLAIAADEEATA